MAISLEQFSSIRERYREWHAIFERRCDGGCPKGGGGGDLWKGERAPEGAGFSVFPIAPEFVTVVDLDFVAVSDRHGGPFRCLAFSAPCGSVGWLLFFLFFFPNTICGADPAGPDREPPVSPSLLPFGLHGLS